MQKPSKIILGIDPGMLAMGYGIIRITGKEIMMVEMGVLKLSSKKDNYERLKQIHLKVLELVQQHQPAEFAIEAPFFGKNVQSMLKLGRAQGVAIAAAMKEGIPVTEYSPRKIKQCITGNGNSDKHQVWMMLNRIMVIGGNHKKQLDASDALAVAVCHHIQHNLPVEVHAVKKRSSQKKNDWVEFIRQNPGRLTKK